MATTIRKREDALMERFKRAVEKIVGKEQPERAASILLSDLRLLQQIAGKHATGGKGEKKRSEMLDRIGDIYEAAFIAERETEVIVPDMSPLSIDIPTSELKDRFARGSQVEVLMRIRESLQTNDFNVFKKSGREKLIAEIDKVL